MQQMETIHGIVERITFQNAENGYTIAKLAEPKKKELTCIIGNMPSLQIGESVRCCGNWVNHLVHGRQFEVHSMEAELPADLNGIRKYLGSGLIRGIGPSTAEKIVAYFGEETLRIIDQDPSQLIKVEGIGSKKMEMIKGCWSEQKSVRDVMIFLRSYDVSPVYAYKIFKTYGESAKKLIQENPFRLAQDIHGIGFKSADKIARKLGFELHSPHRIDAGIEYLLTELSGDGHVCYPQADLITLAQQNLEVSAKEIEERLEFLSFEGRLVMDEFVLDAKLTRFVYLKNLYRAEKGIARELSRLLRHSKLVRSVDVEKALEWVQKELKLALAPNQAEAVKKALETKMHIITGGPGTGKSTITRAILRIMQKLTNRIILAAPTGRAAKRMAEITGWKASTIHSLLEFDFRGGFKRNRENPIACDLIIIDESSMIDTSLMHHLLKAIPDHAIVLFIGDVHQLPSVGPGNVLREMIQSNTLSVTTLVEIYRQAAGSEIITNAHKINAGVFPPISNQESGDCFFIEKEDPQEAIEAILQMIHHRIPKKYKKDPLQDIQVLSPMKKGPLGIENLNQLIQARLNPDGASLQRMGRTYRIGDKVMQTRNNYNKNVFNGDIGFIESIDQTDQVLRIRYEEQLVDYPFSELDELILAYAISIHKSQGSEFPVVIIPITTQHFMMLSRNLLYTAVTRAKELLILVGTKKAGHIAVRNNEVKRRYNGLCQTMQEMLYGKGGV